MVYTEFFFIDIELILFSPGLSKWPDKITELWVTDKGHPVFNSLKPINETNFRVIRR